ncbi:hypothetical protein XELAEV_18004015mg [Xenopus laevis]|nr:hypothetical protein XELAEV_18004015mg [Xenopus laevis]
MKVETSAPDNRGRAQPPGGLQKQEYKFLLLLLLLCLGSFSALVGIVIKYLQVSRELEELSTSHMELNSSLSWEIQSKEEKLTLTHMRLSNLQTEFKQLVQELKNLNRSLQFCNGTQKDTRENLLRIQELYHKTMEEKEKTEKNLKETEMQLQNANMAYCPSQWIRFGMRCLFFSEKKENWETSKLNCQKEMSTLLILRDNDNELQEFLSSKEGDYWVGNEIVWNNRFTWKNSNEFPECWGDNCVKISSGRQQYVKKYLNNRWICEKKLVLLDVAKSDSSLKYRFYLSGENGKYQCQKQ